MFIWKFLLMSLLNKQANFAALWLRIDLTVCISGWWQNFCWVWKWLWNSGITSSFMMMSSSLGDFGTLWLIGWSHTDYFFARCPARVICNKAVGHAGKLQTAVSLAGPLSCSSITFLFRGPLKEWRLCFGNRMKNKNAWKPVVLFLLRDIIMIWFKSTDGHLINYAC